VSLLPSSFAFPGLMPQTEASDHREAGGGGRMQSILPKERDIMALCASSYLYLQAPVHISPQP
jgi:hypothetical protein